MTHLTSSRSSKADSTKNILKTLAAFANTAGGVLLESTSKIEVLSLRYRFTVYLAASIAFPWAMRTESVTPPVTPPGTPPVSKILTALEASGVMGSAEIRVCMGLKDRTHLHEHYIFPALKEE